MAQRRIAKRTRFKSPRLIRQERAARHALGMAILGLVLMLASIGVTVADILNPSGPALQGDAIDALVIIFAAGVALFWIGTLQGEG